MKLFDRIKQDSEILAAGASAAPVDLDLPLPAPLDRFGATVRVAVCGREDGRPIIVLGGISADRFPCRRPDGRAGWWPGLVGEGCAIDPTEHLVIGMDFLADPNGEEAPLPLDQARALRVALDALGIARVDAIVGASYGAMVAMAFGASFPDRVERLVVISADAAPHPSATAMRELQRRVVALGLASGRGNEGLSIARSLAMTTYRTPEEFEQRFEGGLATSDPLGQTAPGSYLRARGDAFIRCMSPERFLCLSASIDRHRVDPSQIKVPTLLIGATSDQLVPPDRMRALERGLGGPARLHLVDSIHGHDMFLKNAETLSELVRPFLGDDR